MLNLRILQAAIAGIAVCAISAQSAHAQSSPITTLRNPLIPGAVSSPPFVCPPEGQPPAVGDGPTPAPVVPGHSGSPELMPWVPAIPANQIDQASSGVNLPVGPPVETPPGVLGPMLTPFIPKSPSTPGADPGPLTAPPGYINPADLVNIIPTGGLPGTGGYYTTINKVRRGGQETHQWGIRENQSILGGGGPTQDEVTLTGPLAGWGLPFGVPTGNGYNKGPAGTNDDLRHSAIDLGGGQRLKMGDCRIPTGSTLIDYGLSATRDNQIGALNAWQSTEFGQGFRRIPLFSHKSTDFGFPYTQFDPANVNPQKRDHLLLPTAVETNF
ncbi:MAG TPA: hypothetical protein V6D17_03990 [Candidatus Obscuribacterales bacterium]